MKINEVKVISDDEKPRIKEGKELRGEYGPNCFSTKDIDRLIETLCKIDKKKARFLLSYVDTPEITNNIPSNWPITRINIKRHIAGFVDKRKVVTEILVQNFMEIEDRQLFLKLEEDSL